MINRYRHIFVLLSQLVLTVPNSANFRKGGDHLRIKDNTQTRTDNHTQKMCIRDSCMIMAIYTGHKMISGKSRKKKEVSVESVED